MNFSAQDNYITVKDFSVSTEEFQLLLNQEYQILKTHPQPEINQLETYYQSPEYISHTDGNKNLFEKLYQIVKKYALSKKVNLINKQVSQKGKILDFGAGTGDFLVACQKNGWETTGFEPNQSAKNKAESKGVYITNNMQNVENQQFDIITLWHVLEHVPNVEQQLQQLKQLLKPNGTLIIAVPNYKSFDAIYYKQHWAAFDVPRHLWHFSKTAIQKLAQNNQMQVVQILPMYFDSFYVSLLSEKYKTGKMNFINAFYIGLLSNIKAIGSKEYSSLIYILKNT